MRTRWHVNWIALITFASFGFMLPSLSVAEEESKLEGMIEIDYPQVGEAKVEVNLVGGLFSLAAKIMKKEEPEASEFLASLEAIKVRIYDKVALGEKTINEVLKFYEEQLQKGKWEILARVREKDSKVAVHLLTDGDIVSGLVVLVGKPEEIIVVNLAGNIDVTKLSQIDKVAGVKLGLSELDCKKRES